MQSIMIEGITRIEGHGKVSIQLDDQGIVQDAHLHVTQFRGFEKFCEGRPFTEMPSLTARICGICPTSHLLAGAKAADAVMSVRIPEVAEKLRRIAHLAQCVQSHALSFFHLSSPDMLLGWDSDPATRNILGVAAQNPQMALDGIRLRKWGQQIIEMLGGSRIHTPWIVAGGVRDPLTEQTRDEILKGLPEALEITRRAIAWFKDTMENYREEIQSFANFPSLFAAITRKDGDLCLYGSRRHYEGWLKVIDANGNVLVDHVQPEDYADVIGEAVDDSSYMKPTYYRPMGFPDGLYRVGPVARLNIAKNCGTPLANQELVEFRKLGCPVHASFYNHYARLIEILFSIERLNQLLSSPDILDTEVRAVAGPNEREGVGIIEAPRGTLIHHYKVDKNGLMTGANLIVATAHNTLAMNKGLVQVAKHFISGKKIQEGMLNRMEAVIRAFDPCLSCATHADGRMALEAVLIGADGRVCGRVRR